MPCEQAAFIFVFGGVTGVGVVGGVEVGGAGDGVTGVEVDGVDSNEELELAVERSSV